MFVYVFFGHTVIIILLTCWYLVLSSTTLKSVAKWDKDYYSVKSAQPKTSFEPPIVDVKVRNPLGYIKNWWKRIIGNEGIDIKIKVRPITTLLVVALILTGTYGLGMITAILAKVPYIKDVIPTPVPLKAPIATPEQWKETAFSGILRFSAITGKYYLTTTSAEAITLDIPQSVDAAKLVGKKIFAVGKFNKATDVLIIADITGLTILPSSSQPIPTVSPTPTPVPEPTSVPILQY